VCINFYWKLFEWITDRYEKTIPDWLEFDHMTLDQKRSQKLKPVFSLRAVIYEFFQKKFMHT